jgi:hypothetical protein
MSRIIVFATLSIIFSLGQAKAQICNDAQTTGLTSPQIISLVSKNYACVGAAPDADWNQLHDSSSASGYVLDWKKGPKDPVDPSDTESHPTGSYLITAPNGTSGPGLITYIYGSNSYGYYVLNNLAVPQYSFCGVSGGAPSLAVLIAPSHC